MSRVVLLTSREGVKESFIELVIVVVVIYFSFPPFFFLEESPYLIKVNERRYCFNSFVVYRCNET